MFRRDGVDASLERIAQEAGVGSATLHRHFRGRRALLAAVFVDTVDALVLELERLSSALPADLVLWAWLDSVVRHCAEDAPLNEAIWRDPSGVEPSSWLPLAEASAAAFSAARQAGRIREGVEPLELLTLVNAIAGASPGDPDGASRLLGLARAGLG